MIKCVCDNCGREIMKFPSQIRGNTYCSSRCSSEDRKDKAMAMRGNSK